MGSGSPGIGYLVKTLADDGKRLMDVAVVKPDALLGRESEGGCG